MQSLKSEKMLHPVVTVSQLTAQIRDVLERAFDDVYVVGEVSNAKVYPSGHWYFSLKDKDATLPCVCFKGANADIKFRLEDGLMVVAQGKLNVYPPRGAYQLVASALEPVGIGQWQLAFDQLKEAMTKEGLLDPARKKPIPLLPRRVGVVTSTAGAALRDILSALARRNRTVSIVIAPTRVQGEGSAAEIAQAISDLEKLGYLDVIIIARGGGSIEDLWAFNSEIVARAVASCSVPVVSGVGHETDITICDLVADLRAPTPTAAAELVARGVSELIDKYKRLEQRLLFTVTERLTKVRHRLDRAHPYKALLRYEDRLKGSVTRLAHHKITMIRLIEHRLQKLRQQWKQHYEKFVALAPENVLNRGFAILRKENGTIIRTYEEVSLGEEIEAILASGRLRLQVVGAARAQSTSAAVASQAVQQEEAPGEKEISLVDQAVNLFDGSIAYIEAIKALNENENENERSSCKNASSPGQSTMAQAGIANDQINCDRSEEKSQDLAGTALNAKPKPKPTPTRQRQAPPRATYFAAYSQQLSIFNSDREDKDDDPNN